MNRHIEVALAPKEERRRLNPIRTSMLNGTFAVRLKSTDEYGQTSFTSISVVVDKGFKVGQLQFAFSDLSVPVAGLPIEVIRSYDSRDKRVGDFGVGWQLGLRNARVEKTSVLGLGWHQTQSGGVIPTYCLEPSAQSPDGTHDEATYDAEGRRLTSKDRAGRVTSFEYDELGRLSTVKDNRLLTLNGGVTSYDYDTVGNLESYQYPNGVKTSYTYNTLNRLTSMNTALGATTQSSYTYTLGPAGNRTAVSELGGRTVNYTYDDLYRLTNETIANDPNGINGSVGYNYDPVGNRLSRTSSVTGVPSQSSTYDANDRLNSDTYDANGNTTASNSNSYAYDFENRLTSLNNGAATFVYDGDGNRVSKTVGGVTTKYSYAQGNPLNNVDPTGHSALALEVQALGTRSIISAMSSLRAIVIAGAIACAATFASTGILNEADLNFGALTPCDARNQPNRVYRGTSRFAEIQAFNETGHILSDAALRAYFETGSLALAYAKAFKTHAEWNALWGNELFHAQAHGVFGIEMSRAFGMDRTFVSVTTDLSTARRFAGPTGKVYTATVPRWEMVPQRFQGAGEGEWLIRVGRIGFQ